MTQPQSDQVPKANAETESSARSTVLKETAETSSNGLTQAEAKARLAKYGYNELPEHKTNPILKFLSYFWGPIPWMIEVAAILSAAVHRWQDFCIIFALLLMNSVVGFWEEFQAGNAVAALKAKLALHARAKRDGNWATIPARELVPGDLLRVSLGEIVPADAKLINCDAVEVDQSALTGESLPVERKTGEDIYSGSILRQGEADAVVTGTGSNTYFGKTANLVATAHTVSHFQRAVLKIGDFLIVIALALVILILTVALFRGDPMLTTLQFALILTVAAVPVAMPAVLSVTMAIGARKLAEKQTIVTHLAAMEEMAGMDVLCSDKTGTLTQNKLTLGEPFCVEGRTPHDVIFAGALACRAGSQDAIDLAVLGGLKDPHEIEPYKLVHFQPFDPVHKRTEAIIEAPDGKQLKTTKGAVQVILALAANADTVRAAVDEAVKTFAARGFRALGVAEMADGGDWQFLGVLPLFDPPREDSKETIAAAAKLGVKVKMVTGDQVAIAREMASQLNLGKNIVDAAILESTKEHESSQVTETIEKADGFAQVFPEHKFHIVRTLQRAGHIVGMTGDGVNDAPALKQADAGIAVSGATDAARAAADLALLSPGLSVIIDAIRESRMMFRRMNSYAIYRIAETIRVLLFMTLCILLFNFYPVTAVMIVLLALLNDGAILSIAYDNTQPGGEPDAWNMKIVLGISTCLGLMGVVETFGLFYIADRWIHMSRPMMQTLIYFKLTVAGQLTLFVARTRGRFWTIRPARPLFLAILGSQFIGLMISVYGIFMTPIGWYWAGAVWVYCIIWFFIEDEVKLAAYRLFDHEGGPMSRFWKHNPRLVAQKPAEQRIRN